MADLISEFLRITAGNLKNLDDLLIRVMGWLSWTWTVIKERCNSFFQMGTVFFGNFLQKRKSFEETSSPLADRILSKTYLSRYLHVIQTISSQQDYLGTLYLAGWQCPALLWSIFFVTFLANKIKLLSVSILAVSATLDNGAEGYYQIVADSDNLKNRFFFLVSVGEKVSYPSAPLSRACPFGVAAFYLQL